MTFIGNALRTNGREVQIVLLVAKSYCWRREND